MIEGLIAGKLYGTAQTRTGPSGRVFTTAKVRAAASDGDTLFVNVITFSDSTAAALLALEDGDAVTLAGTLTPKVWTDKHGEARPALDMNAHAMLTTYHVRRKRRAAQGETTTPATPAGEYDDDL
ncbi:single-stranded DNA-binding protein [Paraburkholderia tagetis]|uniref:Single-stranded DNA-binding protein n=1 Tax=Paraburkholderia tagetis TaxID=2913261 RepID=A0A9X1RP17_9BURK|nr:single-stranded DNA-binding protein [Paraburkholderia tagetis]MCG5073037.1 single-stranded DNA-binding protein [Paraburkholderia tagetis]